MSEWTSSLGVLDLRYMLEIMKQLHIHFQERPLKTWGVELLGQLDLAQLNSLESCTTLRIP